MMKDGKSMNVSVIVPMYHGKKYVGEILKQIEKNKANACDIELQLILYNDCPEEKIKINNTGYDFGVEVINAKKNAGIHGARVNALKQALGEYILFLDQDDVICDNYIESQYKKIGDADAIVCRLINGKRLHYTDTFRFEEVITREFMLNQWCPIVSPGQVLIRREAIPHIWRKNILTNNGADDYFLWLCMLGENRQFALNQEVLFKHVITGRNTSEDTNLMMDSEEEMIEILKREKIFCKYDSKIFDKLRLSLRRIHVKQLDTQRQALECLNRWCCNFLDKEKIYSWVKKNKGRKVAIYGAGELGLGLCEFLSKQGLVPVCYLDQNAAFVLAEIPTYTMEEANIELDSILLTISNKSLKENLRCKFGCEVIDVKNSL